MPSGATRCGEAALRELEAPRCSVGALARAVGLDASSDEEEEEEDDGDDDDEEEEEEDDAPDGADDDPAGGRGGRGELGVPDFVWGAADEVRCSTRAPPPSDAHAHPRRATVAVARDGGDLNGLGVAREDARVARLVYG